MRGVEPLSESNETQLSTSVVVDLDFASLSPNDRLLSCYLDKFPQQASENWPSGIPLIVALSTPMGGGEVER